MAERPTVRDVLDSIKNNALDPEWFDTAEDANPFQVSPLQLLKQRYV